MVTASKSRQRAVEAAIRTRFSQQSGVISRRQAIREGLSPAQVKQRVRSGGWTRRHPGVYLLAGSPGGPRQEGHAALAAAGGSGDAVLSHRSAAWLWDLVDRAPDGCNSPCRPTAGGG